MFCLISDDYIILPLSIVEIMKTLITCLFVLMSACFFGQDTLVGQKDWRLFPSKKMHIKDSVRPAKTLAFGQQGSVEVQKDNRIVAIENQLAEDAYFYGYTVQLEVSQQKSVIKDARYKILKLKPEVDLDDPYEAPNIYLYAGRFYDRVSAYQFKNDISKYFPNAIVVGPRRMDLPSIPMPEVNETIKDSLVQPNGLEGGMGQ